MSFLDVAAQFWSEWGLRISVLLSLSANVLLSLLSGTRRRSASGCRAVLLWFVTRIVLWMAYQGAEIAATSALGSLSLGGSDASAEKQVVIAFWAPFLLLHLAGPDTMTAYALEDNMMSVRKFAMMVFHIWGAFYVLYKYIFRVRSWTLLAMASVIMLLVGAAWYVEKWYALWQSNSMMEDDGESSKKKKKKKKKQVAGAGRSTSSTTSSTEMEVEEKLHDDDDALCLAQDLFHVCRRALADSSVSEKQRATSIKIFQLEWMSMCKVVEMELSLMYEALYTKAIVLHTRPVAGYLIRLLSPLATAAAVYLFNQYMGSRRAIIRGSFVEITYLLLGFALAMDVVWLLRALGSTWTYAALKDKEAAWPWSSHWLRCQLLCRGRWRRLHLIVEYPVQWLLLFCRDRNHPVMSCRTWSGTIGRYNLLHECSAAAAHHHRPRFCNWSWLKKQLDLEEMKYLHKLPHDVKKLLMVRVRLILAWTNPKPAGGERHDGYTMVDIRTRWGQQALDLKGVKDLFVKDDAKLPKFGKEFEEDVLVWHMATCVFLKSDKVTIPAGSSTDHAKAIEVMSEYLMFFVAIRRHMLPGLVLHSLFENTLDALGEIWDDNEGNKKTTTAGWSSSTANNNKDKKLADILLEKATNDKQWFRSDNGRLLVRDAAVLAGNLIRANRTHPQQLLEFIFNVWVDKLLYAAVRCSRESHAKQLSRGGDLTTILWMIVQHAGLFRIGEERPGYKTTAGKVEKKKPAEEKKPKEKKKPEPIAQMPPDVHAWAPPEPEARPPGWEALNWWWWWWPLFQPPRRRRLAWCEQPPTAHPGEPLGEEAPEDQEEAEKADEDEDEDEYDDLPTGYITLY